MRPVVAEAEAGGHSRQGIAAIPPPAHDAAMDAPTDPTALAARYIAVWNEPDADARHEMVRALWAPAALHAIETPPEAVRDAADTLGMPVPAIEARGHEQLDQRVGRAYDEFVAPGVHLFRPGPVAWQHAEIAVLTWEMVTTDGDTVVGDGRNVLVLDRDGRIVTDRLYVS
jgi:hypothetical protein